MASQINQTNGIENYEFLEEMQEGDDLNKDGNGNETNEEVSNVEFHQKRINPWEASMSTLSSIERFNFSSSNPSKTKVTSTLNLSIYFSLLFPILFLVSFSLLKYKLNSNSNSNY